MTWAQLAEMKASGLVDIQSHTFWHPNFNIERKRLAPAAYEKFAQDQLVEVQGRPRAAHWAARSTCWPGRSAYYDDRARSNGPEAAGYVAAFTIDRRPVTRAEKPMALPRSIVTDADRGNRFEVACWRHRNEDPNEITSRRPRRCVCSSWRQAAAAPSNARASSSTAPTGQAAGRRHRHARASRTVLTDAEGQLQDRRPAASR